MNYYKCVYRKSFNNPFKVVPITRHNFYEMFDSFAYDCIPTTDGGYNLYHTHTDVLVAFCSPE